MDIKTCVFKKIDVNFLHHTWTNLQNITNDIVVGGVLDNPYVIINDRVNLDNLINKGTLKNKSGKVPIYRLNFDEESPFYFEPGILYIAGSFKKSILTPKPTHLILKIRNTIADYLSQYDSTIKKDGFFIFNESGQLFSLTAGETEDRVFFQGFLSLNPDNEYQDVINLTDCIRTKFGSVDLNGKSVLQTLEEIVNLLPFENKNINRDFMEQYFVDFVNTHSNKYAIKEEGRI